MISVGHGHRHASRTDPPKRNEAQLFAQRARSEKKAAATRAAPQGPLPLACAALCGVCQGCRQQSWLALYLRERQADNEHRDHRGDLGSSLSCEYALMRAALGAAVPVRIAELQRLPWSMVMALGKQCAGPVGWQGDQLIFRSEKVGTTADLFVDLVTGLAAAAFGKDGVNAFKLHFQARHGERPAPVPARPARQRELGVTGWRACFLVGHDPLACDRSCGGGDGLR